MKIITHNIVTREASIERSISLEGGGYVRIELSDKKDKSSSHIKIVLGKNPNAYSISEAYKYIQFNSKHGTLALLRNLRDALDMLLEDIEEEEI